MTDRPRPEDERDDAGRGGARTDLRDVRGTGAAGASTCPNECAGTASPGAARAGVGTGAALAVAAAIVVRWR